MESTQLARNYTKNAFKKTESRVDITESFNCFTSRGIPGVLLVLCLLFGAVLLLFVPLGISSFLEYGI